MKLSLIDLIKCIQIIRQIKFEAEIQLNKVKRTEFQAKLKHDHPIKSRFPMWNTKTMDRLMKKETINQEKISN